MRRAATPRIQLAVCHIPCGGGWGSPSYESAGARLNSEGMLQFDLPEAVYSREFFKHRYRHGLESTTGDAMVDVPGAAGAKVATGQ